MGPGAKRWACDEAFWGTGQHLDKSEFYQTEQIPFLQKYTLRNAIRLPARYFPNSCTQYVTPPETTAHTPMLP